MSKKKDEIKLGFETENLPAFFSLCICRKEKEKKSKKKKYPK